MNYYSSTMLLLLVLVCAISMSEAVYAGHGQIYFTHRYQYSESGVRVIYRPENYQYYSPIGQGRNAYIAYSGYTTETAAKSNYYNDILDDSSPTAELTWDSSGQYYYYDNYDGHVTAGYWIGYGVGIYDSSYNLIYTDTYNYYTVPSYVQYCEKDYLAIGGDIKCSTVFDGSTGSGSSNGSSSTSSNTGVIVAVVLVIIVLIGIAVGIAICFKKGLIRCGKPPASTNIQQQQGSKIQHISVPPSAPQQQQVPAYQPVASPPLAYQPAPANPPPPPVIPTVVHQQPPPIVVQQQPPPIVVQQQAPAHVNPSFSSSAGNLLTPRNIKLATSAMNLVGSAMDAGMGLADLDGC